MIEIELYKIINRYKKFTYWVIEILKDGKKVNYLRFATEEDYKKTLEKIQADFHIERIQYTTYDLKVYDLNLKVGD